MTVKNFKEEHYPQIVSIYTDGIQTGNATFQNTIPDWNSWNMSHLSYCRLAAFENQEILGWVALSPVSNRCVYTGVAEVSIYIAAAHRTKGVGFTLLQQLIIESEDNGLWTLQSSIFPENIASIKLHKKCDFRIIGYREKIGQRDGIWRDNIIMERRSKIVGI